MVRLADATQRIQPQQPFLTFTLLQSKLATLEASGSSFLLSRIKTNPVTRSSCISSINFSTLLSKQRYSFASFRRITWTGTSASQGGRGSPLNNQMKVSRFHRKAHFNSLTPRVLEIRLMENVRGRVATTRQMPRVTLLSLKVESARY